MGKKAKQIKTHSRISFSNVLLFVITAILAIVGLTADLEGLGIKTIDKAKKVTNIIFDIEALKTPVFSMNSKRDSLFILLTRLDDYGLKKEEQEDVICFSRAIESAIGKIALEYRLPIKTVLKNKSCPINVQQAIELGDFNRADIVIWGKTKNFRSGCLADGIEINFEPTNSYNQNSFNHIRIDTSLLLSNLSAYDVGDKFSILGENTFYHWIQFYINKKIGVQNLSKYRIPEDLDKNKKIEWLYERAKHHVKSGSNELALRDCSQILKLDHNNQLALAFQKEIYLEQGKNEKVIKNLKEQLKLNPNSPELNYELATEFYYKIDSVKGAFPYLEKAEKLGKTDADLYNMKGNFYYTLGDTLVSIENYSKAIEKQQDSEYFFNRGEVYKDLKAYTKAIEDYSSSILVKENESAYYQRSKIRYELKEYDLALSDFKEYSEITDYEMDEANYNYLGNIYWALKEYNICEKAYTKAIDLNDTILVYYTNRVDVYLELDSLEYALKDYNRIIELDSMNPERYLSRAQLFEDMDSLEYALKDYNRIIELDSMNPERYLSRAYFYQEVDSVENVIRDCDLCLSLDSLNINCANLLGLAVIRKGNYTDAIEIFQQLIKSDSIINDSSWYSTLLNNISFALTNYGDCNSGLDSINKSLAIRPSNNYSFKNKGRALYCLGYYSEANLEFDKAIALTPKIKEFYGFRANSRFYNYEFIGAYSDFIKAQSGMNRTLLRLLPYLITILLLIFFFRNIIKNKIIPYFKNFLQLSYNFMKINLARIWSGLVDFLIFYFNKWKIYITDINKQA